MCYECYDKKLTYRLIIDTGVKSKNLKAVAECLDEVASYINENGTKNVTQKDFAVFVGCADNKDAAVRENALKVFAEAYQSHGEDIWRLVKDVPLKVKGLLEQRFKQVAKKSGGNLTQSINSNKSRGGLKNTLGMSNNKARESISGLNSSLGGAGSLKFNRPVEKSKSPERSPRASPRKDVEMTPAEPEAKEEPKPVMVESMIEPPPPKKEEEVIIQKVEELKLAEKSAPVKPDMFYNKP